MVRIVCILQRVSDQISGVVHESHCAPFWVAFGFGYFFRSGTHGSMNKNKETFVPVPELANN